MMTGLAMFIIIVIVHAGAGGEASVQTGSREVHTQTSTHRGQKVNQGISGQHQEKS